MAKAESVEVLITVDDEHMNKLQRVATNLKKAGVVVKQVHDALGTITGTVLKAKMKGLAKIQGVSAIEESQVYQLPPPDAYVQ